ncbi:hypothetical protein REPUB_Repub09cG0162200 [Reevesia pubescens]
MAKETWDFAKLLGFSTIEDEGFFMNKLKEMEERDQAQETMVGNINVCRIYRTWDYGNFGWFFAPLMGNSGVTLSIWDRSSFARDSFMVKERILVIKRKWIKWDFE